MADRMKFELVSPERMLAEMEAEAVTVPGQAGDLTAMANHAPFMTSMRPGLVVVRADGQETRYAVTGGFAEITGESVTILAEEGVEAEAVDRDWMSARVSAFEKAHEDAGEERKQATLQSLHDIRALGQLLNVG